MEKICIQFRFESSQISLKSKRKGSLTRIAVKIGIDVRNAITNKMKKIIIHKFPKQPFRAFPNGIYQSKK